MRVISLLTTCVVLLHGATAKSSLNPFISHSAEVEYGICREDSRFTYQLADFVVPATAKGVMTRIYSAKYNRLVDFWTKHTEMRDIQHDRWRTSRFDSSVQFRSITFKMGDSTSENKIFQVADQRGEMYVQSAVDLEGGFVVNTRLCIMQKGRSASRLILEAGVTSPHEGFLAWLGVDALYNWVFLWSYSKELEAFIRRDIDANKEEYAKIECEGHGQGCTKSTHTTSSSVGGDQKVINLGYNYIGI